MKAAVYARYGLPDVLEIVDVPKPAPKDGEVRIEVRAAAINPLDGYFMRGRPYALRGMSGLRQPTPTCPGVDVAGCVEAVGGAVTRFRPGDDVYGVARGACAEYVCASEGKLVSKPAALTFEQAAAVPVAAVTALQGLRDRGRIQAGQRVLINGAAGGVGTFAVQIAKSFGTNVTGVCSSRNLDMVRSIGADHVLDYTKEDFTRNGRQYDLLFDCVASRGLLARRRLVSPGGMYVVAGVGGIGGRWIGPLARVVKALLLSRLTGNVSMFLASIHVADLTVLNGLMQSGKVTPVIDRCYPLDHAAEAIRHQQTGHARGKIIVTVKQEPPS